MNLFIKNTLVKQNNKLFDLLREKLKENFALYQAVTNAQEASPGRCSGSSVGRGR